MSKKFFSFGLVGYPLEHSVSPILHSTALKTCGLRGDYHLYPVQPLPLGEKGLKEIVNRVKTGEVDGLNVTIPHKTTVIQTLDKTSPETTAIGAVNTIYLRNGDVIGDNTDAEGFGLDLERLVYETGKSDVLNLYNLEKQALVLGAGGAARAVVYSLIKRKWKIIIAARNPTQSDGIAHSIRQKRSGSQILTINLDKNSLRSVTGEINLIVNTTPLGMLPDVKSSPWPEDLAFPANILVYDLVYKPRLTKFIQLAQVQGLPAVNGLGMLVEQAALSFELWTGYSPSRKAMYKKIPDN